MLSHIFLFGHRQQHGKDTCCNILERIFKEKNISYGRTYFAKLLKKQVAEKYNLNFSLMDDNDYKLSKPEHLGGLTVREVLIKEGCGARSIWEDVWANSVYQELFSLNCQIGLVSDYRFPNEYKCFDRSFNYYTSQQNSVDDIVKPKLIRVLVNRSQGIFKNDGADGELPDVEDPKSWDYIIINQDVINWKDRLEENLIGIMQMEKII
jgi:hypothetical protein